MDMLWSIGKQSGESVESVRKNAQRLSFYSADCQVGQALRKAKLKANSHRRARHDKTVLSVSRPLRRCELDSRLLRTVAEGKSGVWTHSEQLSNSHRHARHDPDWSCFVVSGVAVWTEHHSRWRRRYWRAGNYTTSRVDITALVLMNSERWQVVKNLTRRRIAGAPPKKLSLPLRSPVAPT